MHLNSQLLSDITVWSKYARYRADLGRRESWAEIVMRNAQMHIKKFPELEEEIWEAYSYVLNKEVVPSMRSAQFAGKPIELAPNRIYNCAFVQARDYKIFGEIMFLLLGGSGVGFSVQQRHISQLPSIVPPRGRIRYVVQDSQVGWADAIKTLMKAYFLGKPRPEFNFEDIREKGSALVTSGGKAPGPDPLRRGLANIEAILSKKKYGDQLKSIEVFDTICHIAETVLSGGIRRSATIAIFDYADEDMLTSKHGEWWVLNPQRAMANISVALDRRKITRESFDKVFDATQFSGSGEPGFFLTNDPEWGTNPCGEIALQDCGFCNLSEVRVDDVESQDELNARVRAAAIIGTLQASYTDFWYLRPEWADRARQDALLGVSLTGLAGGSSSLDFGEASRIVVATNEEYARRIGINPAKRCTTVKPSGTTSLVLGTSSGIHPWYAPYYIRRMQLSKNEPLYKYVKGRIPELVADHYLRPSDTGILSIPIKAPSDAVFRTEGSLGTLRRVQDIQQSWIDGGHRSGLNKHNVSCTINVKPDEWDIVRDWMWDNREDYAGISLLPHDTGTYKQAPFEEIDEATYEALSKYITEIDLTEIQEEEDQTVLAGEVACAGGACEIE